jgi:hypothetical protein
LPHWPFVVPAARVAEGHEKDGCCATSFRFQSWASAYTGLRP